MDKGTQKPAAGNAQEAIQNVTRGVLRIIAATSGFGLCMLLSFMLVRQWTHDLPPISGVATKVAEAAPVLRSAANGLAALGNDYFPRLKERQPVTSEAAAWATRVVAERAEGILREGVVTAVTTGRSTPVEGGGGAA